MLFAWSAGESWGVAAGVLTVLTLLGVLAKIGTNGFNLLYKMREEQEHQRDEAAWVRKQMQANGLDENVGTGDATMRELVATNTDRITNVVNLAVDNNRRLERMEGNQQDQGRKLVKVIGEHEKALLDHDRFTNNDLIHDQQIIRLTVAVEKLQRKFEQHLEEGHG